MCGKHVGLANSRKTGTQPRLKDIAYSVIVLVRSGPGSLPYSCEENVLQVSQPFADLGMQAIACEEEVPSAIHPSQMFAFLMGNWLPQLIIPSDLFTVVNVDQLAEVLAEPPKESRGRGLLASKVKNNCSDGALKGVMTVMVDDFVETRNLRFDVIVFPSL